MQLPSKRIISFLAFLASVALIAFALYLEMYIKLDPCPLCIIQRVFIMLVGVLFLIALVLKQHTHFTRYYYYFIAFVAVLGGMVSARHIWIQSLPPDQLPSCGAGLRYMLEILPVNQVATMLFQGTGECAKVTWRFLTLSIPEWTLICFVGFALVAVWQALRKN